MSDFKIGDFAIVGAGEGIGCIQEHQLVQVVDKDPNEALSPEVEIKAKCHCGEFATEYIYPTALLTLSEDKQELCRTLFSDLIGERENHGS